MSTGSTQPFRPAGTLIIAASTTQAAALLSGSGDAALIFNASGAVALVSFGVATGDAPAGTQIPVPPGGTRLIGCGVFSRAAAVTLSAGTGNVYVTIGTGTVY
jgi:hypothetical protein